MMMKIEDIGRNNGGKTRGQLEAILHVFRERIASRRWIKLRFILLCNLPSFRSYWSLDLIHRDNAYEEGAFDFDNDDDFMDDTTRNTSANKFQVKHLIMKIPVDSVDVQSVEFWTKTVHVKKVEAGHEFPFVSVTHPMYSLGDGASTDEEGNKLSVIQSVGVQKVFDSFARPKIVALRRAGDGVKLSAIAAAANSVSPKIMIKAGDNLMADVGVMMMFRCFNAIWSADSSIRKKYGDTGIPFAFTFEVTPTSASRGHLEGLTNLNSLAKFSWKAWADENRNNEEVLNEMLRTAVGSYIGSYVLGVRDRHYDNVIVKNNRTMLHIDFSYLLGKVMPADGPPISISPGMEGGFKAAGIWDRFVQVSVDAFKSLRQNSDVVIRIATLLFNKGGFTVGETKKFLESTSSLNTKRREGTALKSVQKQIVDSSKHVGNHLKTFAHNSIEPVWYKLLKDGFPPAQYAMEAYNEMSEQRNRMREERKVKIEDEDPLEI